MEEVEVVVAHRGARAQGEAPARDPGPWQRRPARWLLERDLVDELILRIYPVVVGDGQRLLPEQGHSHGLTLVESLSTPSGVTVQMYRPAGRATFRNADD
ncbi:MAG TPA: dihydrofolate reductase family protein [Candidatus Limnocylindrales bacterium]|nr:dihydrofolate reductase family protein [Candidatus Limnocylindrales bacterium]